MICKESPFESPFQSPEFYQIINSIPGFSAQVFAIEYEGSLQALMLVVIQKVTGIKSFFSRRGIVYGGPLIKENNTLALTFLIQQSVYRLKGKVIYLETRNFFNYNDFDSIFRQKGWQFVPYFNFQINIAGKTPEMVLSNMKYNRRREINLSIKNGVTFSETHSEIDALKIYYILVSLYRARVKLPLPDFSFFKAFLNNELARVFVVKFQDKVVAGSFCLFLPGKNLFTMYYCGERANNNNIFPTSIAIYAAIEFSINQKISVVDMMGAGQPGEVYGVRDYKSQFGGELVEHGRYLKILNPVLYMIGKAGLKLTSKLKL